LADTELITTLLCGTPDKFMNRDLLHSAKRGVLVSD
jgi:hypothetical protein